jgi:AraC-like DNA-binding protein
MKAQFEKVSVNSRKSFRLLELDQPLFGPTWHFHPEVELTWIRNGSGIRCLGHRIERFDDDDLVLIGPNVPHFWDNSPEKGGQPRENGRAIVLLWDIDKLTGNQSLFPELQPIRDFLNQNLAYCFSRDVAEPVFGQLSRLSRQSDIEQLISLISIINYLAHSECRKIPYSFDSKLWESRAHQRIEKFFTLIQNNYYGDISLEDMARHVAMNKSSFSRFIKAHTHATPFEILNEFRITHALKLLVETHMSITEIAYEAGFKSLSNFNHRFHQSKGCSPGSYRKQFRKS